MKNITRCFVLIFGVFCSQFASAQIVSDGLNNSSSLFTITGGAYATGNSAAGDSPATSPFASEGTHGYTITSGTATLTTSSNINTTGYTGISLTFKLASFSIGGSTNGADVADIVTVSVSPDGGTTYYPTLRVLGNSNARWAYSATGTASTAYDGNVTPVDVSAPAGLTTTAPSTMTVTGLPAIANLKVKISMLNDNAAERWAIDNFVINGTPVTPVPEINVRGNSTDIVSGDATPDATDHTDFGNVALGSSLTRTFTIQNTGNANLTVGTVTLATSNDFSITLQPTSPVSGPSGTTTVQVTYTPTVGGSATNTISIPNNDGDEGTYTFAIAASGTLATPTATAASNQQATQFDANWNAVTGATSYRLDVATTSTFLANNTVITDDFEAGTLTNWQNTGNWTNSNVTPITGTRSLRVNAPAAQTTSTIYTQPTAYDVTTGTTTWRFNFKTNYAPSGNNRAHFFLMSSSTTFATANGYAVGFNFSGSDDLIKLCKSTAGTASTMVASSQAVASGTTYGVEVTRSSAGLWTLKVKSGGGFTGMTTAGTATDTSFTTSTYAGLVAATSSSNNQNFRFDDFSIQNEISTCLPSYNDLNVGNVVTYPVTGLSSSTTYYYRVRAVNGGASANSNTITVAPISIGGTVAPSTQTICAGTQPANLVLTGQAGSVVRWEKASDGAFTSPTTIASTATTLTGATIGNLSASTFFRAVVQNGAAPIAYSSTATVSVDPAAVGGTVNGSATVCSTTNSGTLTLVGNTGNVVRWESSTDNFATAGTNIANTTSTLIYNNLAVTTYYRVYVQTGGCSAYSSVATISVGNASTTWDGGAWSNGNPDINKAVVFTGDYQTAGTDLSACSIHVTNNASVVVTNGDDMTVNNGVVVDSGSNLTVQNNGNLLQLTNAANSGDIHLFRGSSAIMRLDYTLWSSPVAGQNLLDFSPLTIATRFYTYNTTTNLYNSITPSTNDFTIGKGYLIRMPDDHPASPTNWFGEFIGVPHNGDVNVAMTNGGSGQRFNLVGNPYPSTINLNEFVDDNSSNITGTLYFWRKTNNAASPSYCTWSQGGFVNNGEAEASDPLGVLQVGQGFLVEAAGAATTVAFNNSQRIGDNFGQFFRSANIEDKNRIWLNATNEAGAYSQMLVGYMANATSGVDYGIDGKYINDGPIALTSTIDATEYAIQGRALPFDVTDVVPLSFKATTAGTYSIAIDHTDGFFSGAEPQDIYLRDNSTAEVHDLNDSAYTFASEAGTFASRFELVFDSQLGVNNPGFNSGNVVVYSQHGTITINSGNTVMSHVEVFDIRGRLLAEKNGINDTVATISAGNTNQVLIVKVTSEANVTVTKKVVN